VGDENEDEDEDENEGEAEAGWQTPTYSDSQAQSQSSSKQYARIIATVKPENSLLEAAAHETAANSAEVKRFLPRAIVSLATEALRSGDRLRFRNSKRRRSAYTPRRYASGDRLFARPRWNRNDPHSPRHPTAQRMEATRIYELATHVAYDKLEAYCSTRLPEMYGKFCRPVLQVFRPLTEGLRYGDRVEQVCMNIKLCPRKSYVRKRPHALANRD